MKNTTLCYLERDGRYLMMLRDKKANDCNEGKWIGVGGKFAPGETPEDCVRREVLEETGFALGQATFHGIVHFVSDTWDDEDMYLFSCDDFAVPDDTPLVEGFPVPTCDEGTLAWIPTDEVMHLNLWEGDRVFLAKLIAHEPFAELTLRYHGDDLVSVE